MEPPTKNQARRYTVEEWEKMKPKIRDLVVKEKQKLKDVMRILEEDLGFVVSEKQVKSRITKWGFDTKNVKGDAMLTMARMHAKRKHFENKESAFRINKQPVDSSKISRYLKRKDISESTLLDMASPIDAPSPAISVFTPRPESPYSDVLLSPPVRNQQQFPSPLPSVHSRIAGAANFDLNVFALEDSSPSTSSCHISAISRRSLRIALQSPAFIYERGLLVHDIGFSEFEPSLTRSSYLHRYIGNIDQPLNSQESTDLPTSYVAFETMSIWRLVAQVSSLCFGNPIRTAHEKAQKLVQVLSIGDTLIAPWDFPLMLRTAKQLKYLWVAEAHRMMCLRVLHQKFPETIGAGFQGPTLAARLFYRLEYKHSGKPCFGHSVELFPLLVLSVLADTPTDILSVRARWEQLPKFHIWNRLWLGNYAGLCWAAAEEYWRQGGVASSSKSNQILAGASDASQSHQVDEREEQLDAASLSRRLRQWVTIFEQIKVHQRLFEIEYHVPKGLWELGINKHNFGMKFVPK